METDLDFAGYELPIFLEDQTGLLTGSVFLDLYNRQKISYLCLSDDSDSDSMSTTIYGIFNRDNPRIAPDIILEFGADNSLGTIKLGKSDAVAMDDYLPRVSSSARCDIFVLSLSLFNDCFLIPSSSKSRHFVASNGERYQWKHCQELDQEWAVSLFFFFPPKGPMVISSLGQCTNSKGEVVSYYSLKLYGEPEYKSSGCMLTVERDFASLSCGKNEIILSVY